MTFGADRLPQTLGNPPDVVAPPQVLSNMVVPLRTWRLALVGLPKRRVTNMVDPLGQQLRFSSVYFSVQISIFF